MIDQRRQFSGAQGGALHTTFKHNSFVVKIARDCVAVATMSFEANLKVEDDGRRHYSRKNIIVPQPPLALMSTAQLTNGLTAGSQACAHVQWHQQENLQEIRIVL